MKTSPLFICQRCTRALHPSTPFPRRLTTSASTSPSPTPPPTTAANLTPQSLTLYSYTSTLQPTEAQLRHATKYFARSPAPKVLWSTPHFRSFPASPYPEVCFLGRSNVGKSSLLNALFGRPREKPAHVSRRPGRTRTMNAFSVGREVEVQRVGEGKEGGKVVPGFGEEKGVVVVVDMPGYGAASREEWGAEILKYLEKRRQLRRTFVLVDAEHGLKGSDLEILRHLAENGISHQVLISKVDKLLHPRARALSANRMNQGLQRLQGMFEEVQHQLKFGGLQIPRAMGDILSCSAEKELAEFGREKGKIGIDAIRWAVLSSCGLGCKPNGMPNEALETSQFKILESEAEVD